MTGGWDFTRESCPRFDSAAAIAAPQEPATSPAERSVAGAGAVRTRPCADAHTRSAGRRLGDPDAVHSRWTGDGPFEVERVDVSTLSQAEFSERYEGFPVVLRGHCVPVHLTVMDAPPFPLIFCQAYSVLTFTSI